MRVSCILGISFLISLLITIVQVCALTQNADNTEKDSFYSQLQDTLVEMPHLDLKIVLSDFNAQLGGYRNRLKLSVGPFPSSEHLSDNGELLISFCDHNNLCIDFNIIVFTRRHDVFQMVSPLMRSITSASVDDGR